MARTLPFDNGVTCDKKLVTFLAIYLNKIGEAMKISFDINRDFPCILGIGIEKTNKNR